MTRRLLKPLVLLLVLAAVLLAARFLPLQAGARGFAAWIQGAGWTGLAAFFVVYVLATVLGLPASPLTLVAGALLGPVRGLLLVSPSSVAGAVAAFLLGRTLLRAWVRERTSRSPGLSALDAAVGRDGWRLVVLLRLSPVFPFALLNYALGGTRIGLGAYALASWIAMVPGTFLYVSLGAAAGAAAGIGGRPQMPAWLLWLGLAATLAVTARIAFLARRALAKSLPTKDLP
jgi:uncharacterized membrane protein YdjX (TVP38/TMEM64 family)